MRFGPSTLLVALLLLLVSVGGAPIAVPKAKETPSALGKLRLAMLRWYCAREAGHEQERPCTNFRFMQRLRAAKDVESRRQIVQERTSSMPKDDASKKRLAQESRSGYMKMYQAYCAQSAPTNPEVCTNEALKKAYAVFAKGSKTLNQKN